MFGSESYVKPIEELTYKEAYARLLFGSHETSPIIWIGKPRNSDTVLVKSREITGRSQTLPLWLGEGGRKVKTTENFFLYLFKNNFLF